MNTTSLLGHTQEILSIILGSTKPADSLIDSFFRSRKYLGSHDRRFIAETAYGTLRHLRKVSALVQRETKGETLFPEDEHLLLIVAYLVGVLGSREVDVAPILPRLRSSQIKERAKAIFDGLKKPLGRASDPDLDLALQQSFPDWLVQRMVKEYGREGAERMCTSLNLPASMTVRVNTLKTTRDECREVLQQHGIESSPTVISPIGLTIHKRLNIFSLEPFKQGWFEVQDEGSQLLSLMLDPRPNAKVLDLCAGAGGKTLSLSAAMKNRGEIVATDVHTYRLEELRKRAKRAGAQNVRVRAIEEVADLEDQYSEFFDIVFVDAPCSGLGTIRRNPGMKWTVTEQTVEEVSEKQWAIVNAASRLVKRGGVLAYATCTLLRQENEDIVDRFISEHSDFSFTAPKVIPNRVHPDSSFRIKLSAHEHGTDGFFFATMTRQ